MYDMRLQENERSRQRLYRDNKNAFHTLTELLSMISDLII